MLLKQSNVVLKLALVLSILLLIFNCKSSTQINKKLESVNKTQIKNKALKVELEYKTDARLGEGAIWNYKTQEFYWIDILGKAFHVYNPKTKTNKTYKTPSLIGTVVPYTKEEVVVALEDGVYKLNLKTSEFKVLSNVESTVTTNRFNDGKCDPLGNLWVGSMSKNQKRKQGSLYKIDKEGRAEKMLDSVSVSNGIAWTKDASTMYYIDTPTGKIRAFDYNKSNASISNERVAIDIPKSMGFGDGFTIDAEGMLWVGLWNGDCVVRFNPKTGELLSKIEVPAHNVTACAFGGENLDILYITTAKADMTAEELILKPLSGSIFRVKPGVKGVESDFFGK